MLALPYVFVLGGLAAVVTAWGTYLATIPKGTVPLRPVGTLLLQAGGAALAAFGMVQAYRAGALGAGHIAPGAFAVMMGLTFLWIFTQRRTPVGDIRVAVGEPLPAFETLDHRGEPFDSGSLRGRRVLLKFFRGSW